jgi:hypothetical protein
VGVGRLEKRIIAQFLATSPPMDSILTLGRQRIGQGKFAVSVDSDLRSQLRSLEEFEWLDEALVTSGRCRKCDALDMSPYEGASILADLSEPDLPRRLHDRFDVVIDFGTTEHVIDIASGLRNSFGLVKPGGYLLMSVPTDGFSGHGYWQLSPAALFDLFEDGAASSVSAFSACPATPNARMRAVESPSSLRGQRTRPPKSPNFPAYLIALVRKERDLLKRSVYQADYLEEWGSGRTDTPPAVLPDRRQDLFTQMSLERLGVRGATQNVRQTLRNAALVVMPGPLIEWMQRDDPKT